MRIAFCLWPISQEGGLATRTAALVSVARECGHDATFIRLSYSGHREGRAESVEATASGLRMHGQRLSIEDDCLLDTLMELEAYDVLVFTHPCPHLSDTQRAVKNWRSVYRETAARKIAYFSDAFVQDYYPWIQDVQGTFSPVATNDSAARHATAFLQETVRTARQVFVFDPDEPVAEKENLVVWAPAWRSWKGVRKFVDAVPAINAGVELYGVGRELHTFRKELGGGVARWPGRLLGQRPPAVVQEAYRRAKVSVDLTGQSKKYVGHYNRTHLEPMFHGCVSACLAAVVAPHSFIPQECVSAVNPQDIAGSINRLLADEPHRQEVAESAQRWATSYFSPQAVMDELLA